MTSRSTLTLVAGRDADDPFRRSTDRLTGILLRHCLIGTHARLHSLELPYRYPTPDSVYPAALPGTLEDPNRNTAFVICVDGTLPAAVRKHFRLRASNRATWRNIRRLLPELDLEDYRTTHNRLDSEAAETFIRRLLPLDYALLIERPPDADGGTAACEVTHLHVKVERLTDNALRELGRRLGYIHRSLYERGEDYVDALEAKFFEYHGFPSHASGRKSAAAIACQLLQQQRLRFAIHIASQESGRLTVLDDTDTVTQYMLVEIGDAAARRRFRASLPDGRRPEDYQVPDAATPSVILRVCFRRTAAALPAESRNRDQDIQQPWLRIAAQQVLPLRPGEAPAFDFAWADPA